MAIYFRNNKVAGAFNDVDDTVTAGSNNPVSSSAVKTYVDSHGTEVIDITSTGISSAIKAKVTAMPSIMFKYNSYIFSPTYNGGDIPTIYTSFKTGGSDSKCIQLDMDWTNYTFAQTEYTLGGSGVNDVRIKSVKFEWDSDYEVATDITVGNNLSYIVDGASYNDPSHMYIVFETTPITSTIETQIATGRFVIRFDYFTPEKSGSKKPRGQGSRGFTPTLYTNSITQTERGSTLKHKTQLENSFVYISASDVKTDLNGNKYIYKKINLVNLGNKFYSAIVSPDNNPRFDANPFVAPNYTSDSLANFDSILVGGSTLMGSKQSSKFCFGKTPMKVTYKTPDSGAIGTFYRGYNNPHFNAFTFLKTDTEQQQKIAFDSRFIRANNFSFIRSYNAFRKLSVATSYGSWYRMARAQYSYNSKELAELFGYTKSKRIVQQSVTVRPRLALLKSGWSTIGQGTGIGTMWEKVYSKCDINICSRLSDCFTNNGSENDCLVATRFYITRQK